MEFSSLLTGLKRQIVRVLVLGLCFSPLSALAGGPPGGGGGGPVTCTFTGAVSNDWGTAGNWDCGHAPISGSDAVVIPSPKTAVFSTATGAATTITIASGASLELTGGNLVGTYLNGGTLTMSGSASLNGGIINSGTFHFDGGTIAAATFFNSGTLTGTAGVMTISSLENSGTVVQNGYRINTTAVHHSAPGTYSTDGTGVIRFSGTDIAQNYTYTSIELSGTLSFPTDSTFVSASSITLLASAVVTTNSSTFALAGNWNVEANVIYNGYGSTVRFTGSGNSHITIDPSAVANFYALQLVKGVPSSKLFLESDATSSRAVVATNGMFDENGYTLHLPAACTFTDGNGDHLWATSGNWDCASVARKPNEIDTVTIPGGLTANIAGSGGGIFATSDEGVAGSLIVASGATVNITQGSLSTYATSSNAGTINVNANGNYHVNGEALGTLTNSGTINGSAASAYMYAHVPVDNTGGTFDFSDGGRLTAYYDFTAYGTRDFSGLGSVTLTGNSTSIYFPIGVANLTIDGISATVLANITILNNLTISTSVINVNGRTITLSGEADLDSTGSGVFSGVSTGSLVFSGSGDQQVTADWSSGPYVPFVTPAMVVNKSAGTVSFGSAAVQPYLFTATSGTVDLGTGYFIPVTGMLIEAHGVVTSTSATIDSPGYTNNGTFVLNGVSTFSSGIARNNATLRIGISATAIFGGSFVNFGAVIGTSTGGSITLSGFGDSFYKGPVSTFTAPQTVTFSGPTGMPNYNYNDVVISSYVTLAATSTGMTLGSVSVDSPAIWTVENTGTTAQDLRLTLGALSIASGGTVNFGGLLAGPIVTSTGSVVNGDTLTIENGELNLTAGFANAGTFTPTNSHIRFSEDGGSLTLPAVVYSQLSLLGTDFISLSASTTVLATTTLGTDAHLSVGLNRLTALGPIQNAGSITVIPGTGFSSGGEVVHPAEYVRFSDVTGTTKASFVDGDSLYVSVSDQGRNLDGTVLETFTMPVTSTLAAGGDEETVTLTETASSSGIFRTSAIAVQGGSSVTASNGAIDVTASGDLQTTYTDDLDPDELVFQTATVTYSQPVVVSSGGSGGGSGGGAIGGGGGGSGSIQPISQLTTPTSTASSTSVATSTPIVGTSTSVVPPVVVATSTTIATSTSIASSTLVELPPASPRVVALVATDTRALGIKVTSEDQARLASFIEFGSSPATIRLGEGERAAQVREAVQTMGRAPSYEDLDRLARGLIPRTRNLVLEQQQLPRVRATFQAIYGNRAPNFQNAAENTVWNTLMYRIRFTRDLTAEQQGAQQFRRLFNRLPQDPFQWATVRALGYVITR